MNAPIFTLAPSVPGPDGDSTPPRDVHPREPEWVHRNRLEDARSLGTTPAVLRMPESAQEHAANLMTWLKDVPPNSDGTYTLTAKQMAAIAMRLNRIVFP